MNDTKMTNTPELNYRLKMKIPVKFVSPLKDEQVNQLKQLMTKSDKPRIRIRSHAILLSHDGFSIDKIAEIFNVGRNTVSRWLDSWEPSGLEGLNDKPRPGGPCKLTLSEKQLVIDLAKETPRSISTIRAKIVEQTGKFVGESTVKRILKAAGQCWKRIRKSVKSKRDDNEFEAASLEIEELKEQHRNKEIELWFFDESGFDLQPSIPYAWQPIGSTIEVPAANSTRLNVLGFITPDNQFESFCFDCSVNTDIVVACFDKFSEADSGKKRIVILDNASIHTSYTFLENLGKLEENGVFIKFLPTYSPELNIIEMLWRFIKYWWLPFQAYSSFEQLVKEVENILRNIGEQFKICFS
jgi:transposase